MPVLPLIPFLYLTERRVVLQRWPFLLLTDSRSDPTWAVAGVCSHGSSGAWAHEQHSWLWLVNVSWNLICYVLDKLKGQAFKKNSHDKDRVSELKWKQQKPDCCPVTLPGFTSLDCLRQNHDTHSSSVPLTKLDVQRALSVCLCLVIVLSYRHSVGQEQSK